MSNMEGVYYDAAGNYIGVARTNITVDKDPVIQIVRYYGYRSQKSKAVEELLELSEVLIKDVNKHELDKDALYEELADVEIMLAQLMQIYDIDLEGLQQEIDRKLDRTIDRINEQSRKYAPR